MDKDVLGRRRGGLPGVLGRPGVLGTLAGLVTLNPAVGAAVGSLRKRQISRNEEKRQRMEAQAELSKQLVLSAQPVPEFDGERLMDPQTRAQVNRGRQINILDTLRKANPQGFTQGVTQGVLGDVFPGATRLPAEIKILDALGKPRSLESLRELSNATAPPQTNAELLNQAMLMLQLKQAQRAADQDAKDIADEEAADKDAKISLIQSLSATTDTLESLADNKVLVPGTPGQEALTAGARVLGIGAGLFGAEDTAASLAAAADKMEIFNTQTNRLVGDLLSIKRKSGDSGTGTIAFQRLVEASKAGRTLGPRANADALIQEVDRLLSSRALKLDPKERLELKRTKASLKRIRGDFSEEEKTYSGGAGYLPADLTIKSTSQ